ncbi:outer membrane beta-barrel protein [Tamlana agarivorans]|uniref:Outer membrane beta-barrel protein n=1 Tax=Pseudotamlana agarivorans TaxID=481183 RepID=A0ACC5U997_9FLAO|nr:outer membrane beta-barrel protein [Tamlana agarivorans]MBU2950909.1 outer membrane beta-barrel protein [Tamlana agarivorans]
MKNFIVLLTFCFVSVTFAQQQAFEITGILTSEDDNLPLEAATVYLQQVKDSTLMTYTISNQKGAFTLENKTSAKTANLYVSFMGYKTYHTKVNLEQLKIDLGTIKLLQNTAVLDAVLIKSQAPVTIKQDTLEFNVKSFKTKKDANIEDLLKELPGVELDPDGKITVNGKPVNQVLVNGKPFFGNDPTIATRNLSKDIIEKIQISDTKTDDEAFTGETVDGENKTVNLVIKKENNKGVFGRVAAGGGTDDRYQAAGMYNQFNDDLRISALVGTNNVNEPGFSYGEINKMFGGRSSYDTNNQLFNYGVDGVITSRNYGLNYVDNWGKKAEASASYFGSNTDNENETISQRENILPDSRYFTSTSSKSAQNADQHKVDSNFKFKIDSTLQITLRPEFRQIKRTNAFQSIQNSYGTDGTPINNSTSNSYTESEEFQFQNNANITKRLKRKGSFLKFDVFYRTQQSEDDNKLINEVNILGSTPQTTALNQLRETDNTKNTFRASVAYRVPLIKKALFLDLRYGYRDITDLNTRMAFDFDENTQKYEPTTNTAFNSDYQYTNITSTPTAGLEYKKKKWTTSLRTDFIFRTLENKDALRPEFDLKRHFNATALQYQLGYNGPKTRVNLRYDLSNQAPSLNQLQTFVDVTNPLNVVVGNPNLSPTDFHNFNIYFNKNNFQKGVGFNFYTFTSISEDAIVAKTTVNDDLVKVTTFENVDGNYRAYIHAGYNKKVKLDSLKTLKINVGLTNNIRRYVNFTNEVKYASLSKSIRPGIGLRFNWKKVMELDAFYNIHFTENTFDTDLFNKQEFTSHSLQLNSRNYFTKSLEWSNNVSYEYNPNISDDFQKSVWFWNSTLAYSFLKDKATVTLKAYDLLNQNNNSRRVVNQNYIEDRQSTVLQQYFMLGFSWKFNTLGKAGEVNSGQRGYIIRR